MMAGLAEEILDGVKSAMVATADEGIDCRVGDVEVTTGDIRTGVASRSNQFLPPTSALELCIRHRRSGHGGLGACSGGGTTRRAVVGGAWVERTRTGGRSTIGPEADGLALMRPPHAEPD